MKKFLTVVLCLILFCGCTGPDNTPGSADNIKTIDLSRHVTDIFKGAGGERVTVLYFNDLFVYYALSEAADESLSHWRVYRYAFDADKHEELMGVPDVYLSSGDGAAVGEDFYYPLVCADESPGGFGDYILKAGPGGAFCVRVGDSAGHLFSLESLNEKLYRQRRRGTDVSSYYVDDMQLLSARPVNILKLRCENGAGRILSGFCAAAGVFYGYVVDFDLDQKTLLIFDENGGIRDSLNLDIDAFLNMGEAGEQDAVSSICAAGDAVILSTAAGRSLVLALRDDTLEEIPAPAALGQLSGHDVLGDPHGASDTVFFRFFSGNKLIRFDAVDESFTEFAFTGFSGDLEFLCRDERGNILLRSAAQGGDTYYLLPADALTS
ncbi:MAG: hypothetical protein ACOX88_09485 [Christensenellales bacterium]|jgi:hypothetical protein